MSPPTAHRGLGLVLWRVLPFAPFVLILAVWSIYWAIARPGLETLPGVQDVARAVWDLAASGACSGASCPSRPSP